MRPISGSFDPYRGYRPLQRAPLADAAPVAPVRSTQIVHGDGSPLIDVELSVRVFADGRSISVRRQTLPDVDGGRRTVGIDAVIR